MLHMNSPMMIQAGQWLRSQICTHCFDTSGTPKKCCQVGMQIGSGDSARYPNPQPFPRRSRKTKANMESTSKGLPFHAVAWSQNIQAQPPQPLQKAYMPLLAFLRTAAIRYLLLESIPVASELVPHKRDATNFLAQGRRAEFLEMSSSFRLRWHGDFFDWADSVCFRQRPVVDA
jgi:hypothetical protein